MDRIEYDGVVENHCKGLFTIRTNDNLIALCTLSGKIRTNSVKILEGDKVRIEVSKYDPAKGRIIYRYK